MSKLQIYPQFGDIEKSKNIKFSISDIEDGQDFCIKFENATNSTIIEYKNKKVEKSPDGLVITGSIDLNIPSNSEHYIYTIFANIYTIGDNNKFQLKEVCPAAYFIEDVPEKISFDGKVFIYPQFITPEEDCKIRIFADPKEKYLFSINKKTFKILTNKDGIGTINFKGSDVIDNNSGSVIQRFPLYHYSNNERKITGFYLNIAPESIKATAIIEGKTDPEVWLPEGLDPRCEGDFNLADWVPPEWCFDIPGYPDPKPLEPTNPPLGIPTKDKECKDHEVLSEYDICKIVSHDSTSLSNSMALNAFVSVDSSIQDRNEKGYNIPRIFLSEDETSIQSNVIVGRDVAISPASYDEDFEIYITEDVFNRISMTMKYRFLYVCILDEKFNYNDYKITGLYSPSVYDSGYRVRVAQKIPPIQVEEWSTCKYVIFYEDTDVTDDSHLPPSEDLNLNDFRKLPFIEDVYGNYLPISNVSIACNRDRIGEYGESFIYIIAEALKDNKSQLFFYSFIAGDDLDFNPSDPDNIFVAESFGWLQLTKKGNNRKPNITIDKTNNLHLLWESDRSGPEQVFYSVIGPSSISYFNSSLGSAIEKQIGGKNDIFYHLETPLLIDREDDIEYLDIDFDSIGNNSQISGNNIEISGSNTLEDTDLVYTDVYFYPFSEDGASQINYQISFDVEKIDLEQNKTDINIDGVLKDHDISIEYDKWKSDFNLETDEFFEGYPVYSDSDNNRFVIGREDKVYDRFIPMVGSYDIPDGATEFQVSISGEENNLKHFSIGIIPEKVRFKASNIETESEYEIRTGGTEDYLKENIQDIYTGRGKFCVILNSEDGYGHIDKDNLIIRNLPGSFNFNKSFSFEVLVNYSKLYNEDVANLLNIDEDISVDINRYICSLTILQNKKPIFSKSFLVDLTKWLEENEKFNIGFGLTSNTCFITNDHYLYNSLVFENSIVDYTFNNIEISNPKYIPNSDLIDIPFPISNRKDMIVPNSAYSDDEQNVFNYENYYPLKKLLTLGLEGASHTAIFSSEKEIEIKDYETEYNIENIDKIIFKYKTWDNPDCFSIYDAENPTNLLWQSWNEENEDCYVLTEDEWFSVELVEEIENVKKILIVINRFCGGGGWSYKLDTYKYRSEDDTYVYDIVDEIMQVPVTIDGINKSSDLYLGNDNEIYITWQSNRNRYWDIYYSDSVNKLSPFRYDTRITDTISNSLSPSVASDLIGRRMIVWHDDRDGKFDIYSARSLSNPLLPTSTCENMSNLLYPVETDFEKEEGYYKFKDLTKNEISFIYTNETGTTNIFSFRIIFYTDKYYYNYKYAAYSNDDYKRWYIRDDDGLSPFSSGEIEMQPDESIEVVYFPEVLPSSKIKFQREHIINDSDIKEWSLLCGVKYYTKIQYYDGDTTNNLTSEVVVFPCGAVSSLEWGNSLDSKNWLCSGQGKADLRVSKKSADCLFPDIASNRFDNFKIVWQERNLDGQIISGSIWDADSDKIYSSGQGLYDKKYLSKGYRPKIITDWAQNFYISSYVYNQIYSYKCNMPISIIEDDIDPTIEIIDDFCYPGYGKMLDKSISNLQARISKEYVSNSLVVSKNKVIPVIEKEDIKIEVSGIEGAYAVRLRNAESSNWSEWINIDSELYFENESDTISKIWHAYFIEDNRFIVPWRLSKRNGARRVCLQVLTYYGKSKVCCVDFLSNMDIITYSVEYYWDENLEEQVNMHKGYPIVSEELDENGIPKSDETTIYIKVLVSGSYSQDNLKFNAIQTGLHDQYGLSLSYISPGVFKGEFKVYKHDGIFDIDGFGFINVIFPDGYDPKKTDPYLSIVDKNLEAENVFEEYLSGKVYKVLDINSFQQYYNNDDLKYRFGNPEYYRF